MSSALNIAMIVVFFVIVSLCATALDVEHNTFEPDDFIAGNINITNSSSAYEDATEWSIWDWIKTFFKMMLWDSGFTGTIASVVNLIVFFPLRVVFWWEAITVIKDLIPFT